MASCLNTYRVRYADVSLRETVVTPNIEIALSELAQRYRLAVATSKPLAFAESLSVQGESKANTVAVALKMLGHPERAVMVGDRSHDIRELRDAGAEAIVDIPAELAESVRQLLGGG